MSLGDYEELRERGQQTLIQFLTVELQLSFSFAESAEENRDRGNDGRYKQCVQNARKGLETIRHFEGRITDREAWQRIHEQGDRLEQLLSTFPA